eukprot:2854200-Pyramimonas_sp.AAC.1
METVYFAITVGMYKAPDLRHFLSQVSNQGHATTPQRIRDPWRGSSSTSRRALTSSHAQGGERPSIARVPNGWRHIDVVDIKKEIDAQ